MIRATPPTDCPVITGLVAHLNKCVEAKFYVDLYARDIRGDGPSGSGFFAEATDAKAARAEARGHLRKYPVWDRATLYEADRGERGRRLATFTNRKAGA